MGDDAVAMPTKLLEGSLVFCQVSRENAIPLIPENPSPPPVTPSAVGWVTLASARVNVIPSAPEPGPMYASNVAEMPTPGTGAGQNAEPTTQLVAGVSCRLAGEAVVTSCAEPLSCQPPATGDGIEPGGGGGVASKVYRSFVLVALVPPPGVVTVTSTVPV